MFIIFIVFLKFYHSLNQFGKFSSLLTGWFSAYWSDITIKFNNESKEKKDVKVFQVQYEKEL